jgi:hypothetical protein
MSQARRAVLYCAATCVGVTEKLAACAFRADKKYSVQGKKKGRKPSFYLFFFDLS